MTTPRENYLKVFKHERPDWIPTYIGCDSHNQPSRESMPEKLAEKLTSIDADSSIHLDRWFGLDIFASAAIPLKAENPNCSLTNENHGNELHCYCETPAGIICQIYQKVENSPGYIVKHFIENKKDIECFATFKFEVQLMSFD